MLEWAAGERDDNKRFDGTIAEPCRGSTKWTRQAPFNGSSRTRSAKTSTCSRSSRRRSASASLAALKIGDSAAGMMRRRSRRRPAGRERVRKRPWHHQEASRDVRLRRHGRTATSASASHEVLEQARFAQPARRAIKLELHHVEAFIAKAIEMGRLSLALGTALQFETVMRQKDVIGEWEPIPPARPHRASCSRPTMGKWPHMG